MLMRMKEKGHFKNINKETPIKDLLRRLVIIENKQISIKHQRQNKKDELEIELENL